MVRLEGDKQNILRSRRVLVCPLSVARFFPPALLPLSGRVPVLKKLAFISTHSRNQQDGVFEEARGAARAWLDVQGDATYGKRIRASLHYKQRYSNFPQIQRMTIWRRSPRHSGRGSP